MNREELPNEATREDKMREALKHYEELATKACWHRSDIPDAIRAYYASLPPAEGAETILKEGLDDGRYADITDGINIDVKQPFYQAIIRYAEDVVAAQQQPTAEGAEEIDDETIAWAAEHQCGTPFSERWIGFVKGAKWHRSLHAQRIADKMVSERLREELIKYESFAGCEYGTRKELEEFVDEYLKSREK